MDPAEITTSVEDQEEYIPTGNGDAGSEPSDHNPAEIGGDETKEAGRFLFSDQIEGSEAAYHRRPIESVEVHCFREEGGGVHGVPMRPAA